MGWLSTNDLEGLVWCLEVVIRSDTSLRDLFAAILWALQLPYSLIVVA